MTQEVILHVEVDGENVPFGVSTGKDHGNVGLTTTSVPAEFEVNGETVTIEVEAVIDTSDVGGV